MQEFKRYSEATPAEQLEMLQSAVEEAATPEGLDVRSLAAEAVERYWSATDANAVVPTVDAELTTAAMMRKVRLAPDIPFRREFWLEAALAVVPVLAALVSVLLPARLDVRPPSWLPVAGVLISFSGIAAVYLWLRMDSANLRPVFASFRQATGALVAGLALAVVVGVGSFRSLEAQIETSLELAQLELQVLALRSMTCGSPACETLSQGSGSGVVRLTSTSEGPRKTYTAEVANVPGKVFTTLDSAANVATIYRKFGEHDEQAVAEIAAGKITKVSGNKIVLDFGGAEPRTLWASADDVSIASLEGEWAVAAFDPETGRTTDLIPLSPSEWNARLAMEASASANPGV